MARRDLTDEEFMLRFNDRTPRRCRKCNRLKILCESYQFDKRVALYSRTCKLCNQEVRNVKLRARAALLRGDGPDRRGLAARRYWQAWRAEHAPKIKALLDLRSMSITEIAKQAGCSIGTVRKYVREYGWPKPVNVKTGVYDYLTQDFIRSVHAHLIKGCTIRGIARALEKSPGSVVSVVDRYNLRGHGKLLAHYQTSHRRQVRVEEAA